ncbi:MAG TPA: glycosyltransferase family 2 protein [Bryobacteraceae bacterium]|nr:glycosyltransferase family 2 protein [Bryobacteraceae bacterium]
MMQAFLFLSILLFVYPFAVYPAILLWFVPQKRRSEAATQDASDCPAVALVICALNEARVIRGRIENCLALDYPREKLRVIVVSDGSTDATASIAREYTSRGVELIERHERRGKIANLNEVIAARSEEIVVLSDANVLWQAQALRKLMARFTDPTVGCVSGKVYLKDTAEPLASSEANYYDLEWRLQERASALYSMAGADGAMYALRRELFRPCPNDTLIDDYVIATSVVRQGKRVVFEPQAIGWEHGPASLAEEFHRKVRIAAGAAQGLLRGNAWPSRCPPSFWLVFLSHKFLRWVAPVSGLLCLVFAAATWDSMFSRVVVVGFAFLAVLAMVRMLTRWTNPFLDAPFYFLFGQVAATVGLIRGITGRQSVLWKKADR